MESVTSVHLKEKTIIKEKKRESNFELLRILSMICIIAHHYTVHGGSLFLQSGPNIGIAEFLYLGGKLGVDCFVLISGYFMVKSKFKVKKFIKIVFEVLFYMIVTMIIFKDFKLLSFKGAEDINVFEDYWFIKAYLGLYIVSPFLNELIRKMDKHRHLKLIIVLTFMQGFLPTFFENSLFTNYLTWFSYVYIIGAYIRLYPSEKFNNKKKTALLFVLGYIIILMPSIFYIITGKNSPYLLEITQNLASTFSLAILFCAVMLFILFRNIKIEANNIINIISSTTFGIYLIHDNSFISGLLWGCWVRAGDFYSVPMLYYIGHAILSVGLIFILCSLIDMIRMYGIEKWIFKINIFDKYFKKIDDWIN